jgi:hypothetical protein
MAMYILYGLVCLALGGLMLVSVLDQLFFHHGAGGDAHPDVLACGRDVTKLLDDLDDGAVKLQKDALHTPAAEVDTAWQAFERDWHLRWEAVGQKCRFSALSGTGLGAAYDRIAEAHAGLGRISVIYEDFMARFSRELAEELVTTRRALDRAVAEATSGPTTGQKP